MTGGARRSKDPEDVEFERLYGPWQPYDPDQAADLLAGVEAPWWICGGYAIEAFTGVRRTHEDIDIAMFADDLAAIRTHFAGRMDLWSAGAGALRPLTERWPEPHPDASQLWLREHGRAPWRLDLLLSESRDGRWVFRRDPAYTLPLAEATWTDQRGRRILKPEIVLAYKAKLARAKDDADFAATWRLLDHQARTWLWHTVRRLHPDHPWLSRMVAPTDTVCRTGRDVRLRELAAADASVLDDWELDTQVRGIFNEFGLPPAEPLTERVGRGERFVSLDAGKLVVERVRDGVLVGDVSWHLVRYGPNEQSRALNVGIALVPHARGHGYGTEAQRLLAELLLEVFDVGRVEASTDVENVAEQRALQRAGFRREGVLRRAQHRAGGLHDLVVYSVVRADLPLAR